MKKKILLLWVLLSTAVCTFAYVFESGDLHYNITSDSTVEVTYQKMSSDNYSGLTSVIIPESVTYDGTTYNIMNIGYRAFQKCTSLTSVTIGNGVTTIGEQAFQNCTSLTSVTIGNGVTIIEINAFSGCTGLTSVTIPNSVTTIRYEAFSDCSGLTSITIPISVTSIKGNAFVGCNSLASIKVESGNAVYDSRNNCNAIIETATNTLVAGCRNTIIPNSVTSIGSEAFAGCTGLTSITIPNSVTNIGSYAFYGCTGLTSITIPNSVTTIGGRAFDGTPWYDNQPDGVVYVNRMLYAYKGTMPQGTNIVVKKGTTSICSMAFYGCTGLTSITIPNSVTSIGSEAFSGCSGLMSITIPNSVTTIGNRAFSGCSGLTSITIPNSVTTIE